MPTALATVLCTASDIADLLSQEGEDLRLDDDGSGTVDGTELARLTRITYFATEEVMSYLNAYDLADLVNSWQVNRWATVIGARLLCRRRGNPVPASIEEEYEEAVAMMTAVRDDGVELATVGRRNVPWPTHSAVRVDHSYNVRKARVERPLSERTPIQGRRSVDRAADFIGPAEEW